MSIVDVFIMAIRNLYKRMLRTSLTVLGVLIGVWLIVIMVSMGIASNNSFKSMMENMGDLTVINMYNWQAYQGMDKSKPVFDDDAIAEISKIKGVKAVSPIISQNIKLVSGRYSASVNVYGVSKEAFPFISGELSSGTTFSEASSSKIELVFGPEVPKTFMSDFQRRQNNENNRRGGYREYYGGSMGGGGNLGDNPDEKPPSIDVLKERITGSYNDQYGNKDPQYQNNKKPDVYEFTGVGILAKNETDYRSTYSAYMDYKVLLKIKKDELKYNLSFDKNANKNKTYGYEEGIIKCETVDDVEKVIAKLTVMGFETNSPTQYINQLKATREKNQVFLLIIGSISLFVSAIGIANTMIMSIYERTREIGIMKVIGASLLDIMKMFLMEAVLIGIIGGVIGLLFSYSTSYVMNTLSLSVLSDPNQMGMGGGMEAKVSEIPLWLSFVAITFSGLVGILSGFFPARRAMNLPALAAIKSE